MNTAAVHRRGLKGRFPAISFVVILITAFGVLSGARPVQACSCDETPTLASILADPATTAFIGEATSVTEVSKDVVRYNIRVDKPLKGYSGPTITVETVKGGALCGLEVPLNVVIGMTLSEGDKGRFSGNLCGSDTVTTNISAFETWAAGTLPAPPGTGPVAGIGQVGPKIWAAFDQQLRVLGYIGLDANLGLSTCPGGRFAYGVDWSKDPIRTAVLVDLSTLLVTRTPMNDQQTSVYCLDADGLLGLGNPDLGSGLETVSRTGRRGAVAAPSKYQRLVGPTDALASLVWIGNAETVTTDIAGNVQRRIARGPSPDYPRVKDQFLIEETEFNSSDTKRNPFSVTDLTTGTVVKVDASDTPWQYGADHLYRFVDRSTLDVIALPDGARSQLSITGGPTEGDWDLVVADSGVVALYDTAATAAGQPAAFYLIDATGAATSFADIVGIPELLAWETGVTVASTGDGTTRLIKSGATEPVLTPYFTYYVQRVNGPALSATACGRTAIPTTGYVCSPPKLPPLL